MTTTLRPVGPEERSRAGARSRAYDICVNARPVGTVRLSTGEGPLARGGRIVQLAVAEGERRRGRATVALLAAEEVLRGWGCERAEIEAPSDAEGALPLALALGYREHARAMVKEPEPSADPAPPPDGTVRPMTDAEYTAWAVRDRATLAETHRGLGVPAREAEALAAEAHRTLLPEGPATPGMVMRVLTRGGAEVGSVWLRVDGAPWPDAQGWIYAVEVAEALRGQGHGRALMLAAEAESRSAGVRLLGLNVRTDNTPALRLYESLGYRPFVHRLRKLL